MSDIKRKLREWYSVNSSVSFILGGIFALVGTGGTVSSIIGTGWDESMTLTVRTLAALGFGFIAVGIHQHKLHQKTRYKYTWKSHDEL